MHSYSAMQRTSTMRLSSAAFTTRRASHFERASPLVAPLSPRHLLAKRPAIAKTFIAMATPPTSDDAMISVPKLTTFRLLPLIDPHTHSITRPLDLPLSSVGALFTIYNANEEPQYVGITRTLRQTLLQILYRKPHDAVYYRAAALARIHEPELQVWRAAWFDEMGGMPPGNASASARQEWQKDVVGVDNNDAVKEARQVMEVLVSQRGMDRAVLVLDEQGAAEHRVALRLDEPSLLTDQVAQTATTVIQATSSVQKGGELTLTVVYNQDTKGGSLHDVIASYQGKETKHRILLSRDYVEALQMTPMELITRTLRFLFAQPIPRQLEGVRGPDVFPINYFAIGQVAQQFPTFRQAFDDVMREGDELPDAIFHWRNSAAIEPQGVVDEIDSLRNAFDSRP